MTIAGKFARPFRVDDGRKFRLTRSRSSTSRTPKVDAAKRKELKGVRAALEAEGKKG
jgi:hypothetical protein